VSGVKRPLVQSQIKEKDQMDPTEIQGSWEAYDAIPKDFRKKIRSVKCLGLGAGGGGGGRAEPTFKHSLG